MGDRTIQFSAAAVVLASIVGAGALLPKIVEQSDRAQLRYTDASIEGAPPIVAVGAAIGALRGLIVDYLWIRLQQMRELHLFYDAQRLADLITKLQPRFAEVWAFHGHNLAYNLSVITSTPDERWRLVNAGIDLIRNKGLRYNPNDLVLYKELAWFFAHKVDGVSDDAHLHYKRELAHEWQLILGTPPYEQADRVKWMQEIADAPSTYEELAAKDPAVKTLVDKLTADLDVLDRRVRFKLDKEFLMNLGRWAAVRSSPYAQMLHHHERLRERDPVYVAMDNLLSDPANRPALLKLVAFLRKKVLLDDYNMDPRIIAQYMKEYGPLDFRHAQAHAFYWARLGSTVGTARYQNEEDVYKIVNDDRITLQAMHGLSQSGLMSVDVFSNDNPGRMYDPRWIKSIDKYFRELYTKHFTTRGAGGDTFADAHQNFMSDAVRELYHSGDIEGAQEILTELDSLYGRGGLITNQQYNKPLDLFVQETAYGEYERVPNVARTDVMAVLRRGFIEGYLLDRKKVLDQALKFASDLTKFFKGNMYNDFVSKFGEGRMADIVGGLERSVEDTLEYIMKDTSIPLTDRLTIYNKLPEEQRAMCYDAAREQVAAEFALTPLAGPYKFENIFAEPPNMDAYRVRQAELAKERDAAVKSREGQGMQLKR